MQNGGANCYVPYRSLTKKKERCGVEHTYSSDVNVLLHEFVKHSKNIYA
jgi:hypothetical protein